MKAFQQFARVANEQQPSNGVVSYSKSQQPMAIGSYMSNSSMAPPMTPAMAMLEAHAKIMKARHNNLQLKQQLAQRIVMENQARQHQQSPQYTQLPPINQQQQQQQPIPHVLLDRIGQLERALADLTGKSLPKPADKKNTSIPEDHHDDEDEHESQTSAPSKPKHLKQLANAVKSLGAFTHSSKPTKPPDPSAGNENQNEKPHAHPVAAPPPKRAVAPPPLPEPLPAVDPKRLSTVALQMAATVEENQRLLKKQGGGDDEGAGDKGDREEAKNRIRKLMKRAEKHFQRMPRWRHKLKGVNDPPKEALLQGKALFRVIAQAIISMFIRPQLAIRKRRTRFKAEESRDLEKDINAFSEYLSGHIGKIIKTPMSSVEQDTTLDLDIRGLRGDSLRQRVMQVKVRVKGIVTCLAESELPPVKIGRIGDGGEMDNPLVMFLIRLIDDNNYFPQSYLFETETKIFEFNDLGGTRNMLVSTDGQYPVPVLLDGMKRTEVMLGASKNRRVDATRARLILSNFIMIRILIGQAVLLPWNCGAARRPKHRVTTVVNNCRVVGSALYMLLQHVDGSLPGISRAEGEEARGGPPAASAAKTPLPQEDKSSFFSMFGGKNAAAAPAYKDAGDDVVVQRILETHSNYQDSLPTILNNLLSPSEFSVAKPLMEEWIPELAGKMDAFITKLLNHLLDARAVLKGSFDDELEALEADKKSPLGLDLSRVDPSKGALSYRGRLTQRDRPSARPGTRQKLPPPTPLGQEIRPIAR